MASSFLLSSSYLFAATFSQITESKQYNIHRSTDWLVLGSLVVWRLFFWFPFFMVSKQLNKMRSALKLELKKTKAYP